MTSQEMKKSDNKAQEQQKQDSMSLTGHLKELRNRLVVCVLVLVVGVCVCLTLAPRIVTLLTDMGTAYQYRFVYIAPQELLLVYLSVALLGGVVLSAPVLAYEIYAFCSPGLRRRERAFFLGAMLSGALCFCVGVLFAYFISVPFMLQFLIQFTTEVSVSASISIEEYMNFLMTVFVIFGVVFELPVISVLLTTMGIVKVEWMVKSRKVMIVLSFVLAAIITPPDIVSQIMVAIPIIGLYELSIVLCRLVSKTKKKESAE